MANIGSVRNSKLRTCKQFKNTFALENDLIITPNFKNRKLIPAFRCSNHELIIEKGRHKKLMLRRDFTAGCPKKNFNCLIFM